jgi:PKD repeat protein
MKKVFLLLPVLLVQFTISAQISANFIMSSNFGCEPFSVEFINTSTGDITEYFWDFGNGETSDFQHPVFTYTESGEYLVSLIVSNQIDSDTAMSMVTVYEAPTAEFIADPLIGDAPLTVDFINLSTGNILSYLWDFGDGGTSFLQNPGSNIYSEAGMYYIILWVVDINSSCQSIFTTEIAVLNPLSVSNPKSEIDYLKVFPNPVTGLLNVRIEHWENATMSLINVENQIILKEKFDSELKQIETSKYPKGTYFVKVESDNFVKTEKIILD